MPLKGWLTSTHRGYFPNHEEQTPALYKSHPFIDNHYKSALPTSKLHAHGLFSNASSDMSSPGSDTTPRATTDQPSSSYQSSSTFSPSVAAPEALTIPRGKYHPSNYKITPPATVENIRPPPSLKIPSISSPKAQKTHHSHQAPDFKRKLQQYQRSMAQQARAASNAPMAPPSSIKPLSPRLLPLGSPGPITPLELEESAGYLMAGARPTSNYMMGGSLQSDRERELVGRMIRAEEESRRREGQSSPAARV